MPCRSYSPRRAGPARARDVSLARRHDDARRISVQARDGSGQGASRRDDAWARRRLRGQCPGQVHRRDVVVAPQGVGSHLGGRGIRDPARRFVRPARLLQGVPALLLCRSPCGRQRGHGASARCLRRAGMAARPARRHPRPHRPARLVERRWHHADGDLRHGARHYRADAHHRLPRRAGVLCELRAARPLRRHAAQALCADARLSRHRRRGDRLEALRAPRRAEPCRRRTDRDRALSRRHARIRCARCATHAVEANIPAAKDAKVRALAFFGRHLRP